MESQGKNKKDPAILAKSLIFLVPGTGIEPVRANARGILSPLRLPVPPPGQVRGIISDCVPGVSTVKAGN